MKDEFEIVQKISLVKKCIYQVWIVMKRICQAGVDNL